LSPEEPEAAEKRLERAIITWPETAEPGSGEEATASKKPASGSKKQAYGSKEKASGSEKPASGANEPASGANEPASGSKEPAFLVWARTFLTKRTKEHMKLLQLRKH
jgi:hypothetical protein